MTYPIRAPLCQLPYDRTALGLYIDCCTALTGTKLLGALFDAGLELNRVQELLTSFTLGEAVIVTERRVNGGISGLHVDITAGAPSTLDGAPVQRRLVAREYTPVRMAHAQRVLDHIMLPTTFGGEQARVEAIALFLGLELLGIEQIFVSPMPALPKLLDTDGLLPPIDRAVAVIAALATVGQPAMRLQRIGYGIGDRVTDRPDLLRVWIGDITVKHETSTELYQHGGWSHRHTSTTTDIQHPSDTIASTASAARSIILLTDSTTQARVLPSEDAQLAQRMRTRLKLPVAVCTLERGGASLSNALRTRIDAGDQEIIVLPLLIGDAHPQMRDVAGVIRWAQQIWPERRFLCSSPLLSADHLVTLLARTATMLKLPAEPSTDEVIILVGPGSDDRHWNAEAYQLGRLLAEQRDGAWVEVAFAEHTTPTIVEMLRRCVTLGAQRIVLLPLALHDGRLREQLAKRVLSLRPHFPGVDITLAPPLARPEGIAAIVLQRYADVLATSMAATPAPSADPFAGTRWAMHDHAHPAEPSATLLPPRYRTGAVSAAPMGAAPMRYDADGNVAWNDLWTDFCDLALAGGPPHRGELLEPVNPEAVRADPVGYAQVVAELARGLQLVTGLSVVTQSAPGWIGLVCQSEAMALWLLRAIVVENVSVRREAATLFFPAGPSFQLAYEIKNIITVVAKTHHYWMEHQDAAAL